MRNQPHAISTRQVWSALRLRSIPLTRPDKISDVCTDMLCQMLTAIHSPDVRRCGRLPKRLLATVIVGLVVILTACGGSASTESTASEPAPAPEPVVEEATAAPTEVPTAVPTEVPTEAPTEIPTEVPTEVVEEPAEVTEDAAVGAEADLDAGGAIFAANCARCHGDDGGGTDRGKSLAGIATSNPDAEHQIGIITNGKGRMPPFMDDLTPEDIDAVVNYIRATF